MMLSIQVPEYLYNNFYNVFKKLKNRKTGISFSRLQLFVYNITGCYYAANNIQNIIINEGILVFNGEKYLLTENIKNIKLSTT